LDTVLGLVERLVVRVDRDRRRREPEPKAARLREGDIAIGKPLSSVLPDDVFTIIEERRSTRPGGAGESGRSGRPPGAGARGTAAAPVQVEPLPTAVR
jgi:hypothetical protein